MVAAAAAAAVVVAVDVAAGADVADVADVAPHVAADEMNLQMLNFGWRYAGDKNFFAEWGFSSLRRS